MPVTVILLNAGREFPLACREGRRTRHPRVSAWFSASVPVTRRRARSKKRTGVWITEQGQSLGEQQNGDPPLLLL